MSAAPPVHPDPSGRPLKPPRGAGRYRADVLERSPPRPVRWSLHPRARLSFGHQESPMSRSPSASTAARALFASAGLLITAAAHGQCEPRWILSDPDPGLHDLVFALTTW